MRSLLFTPADRLDRFRKAVAAGAADVVVADLEDAVAPRAKDAARAGLVTALRDMPPGRARRGVRINTGERGDADLAALEGVDLDLVVVPKAEDPARLRALADALPAGAAMVAIVETARGVLAAADLAAGPRVAALAFGAEDLAADAGLRRSPGNSEVAMPRAWLALACAAHGVAALDMITADVRDLDRVRRETAEAAALGYTGKMCIHPDQAEAVHAALAPAEEDVQWARRVLEAAAASGAEAGGVVVVDGRMVDVPLVRQARRILERAGAPG